MMLFWAGWGKSFYWSLDICFKHSNFTPLLSWADFLNPGYDQYVYRHPNGYVFNFEKSTSGFRGFWWNLHFHNVHLRLAIVRYVFYLQRELLVDTKNVKCWVTKKAECVLHNIIVVPANKWLVLVLGIYFLHTVTLVDKCQSMPLCFLISADRDF